MMILVEDETIETFGKLSLSQWSDLRLRYYS
jgi:hypothetical protein